MNNVRLAVTIALSVIATALITGSVFYWSNGPAIAKNGPEVPLRQEKSVLRGDDESWQLPFDNGDMLGQPEIDKRLQWQCPSARFFGGYSREDPKRGKLPPGDGGRWVCYPDTIRQAAESGNCLIYSIGSAS